MVKSDGSYTKCAVLVIVMLCLHLTCAKAGEQGAGERGDESQPEAGGKRPEPRETHPHAHGDHSKDEESPSTPCEKDSQPGKKHPGSHKAHSRHAAGVMGVYATAFHHEHVIHHGGFGLFYKILVVPDWLLIEFAAKTVFSDHGTAVPLELSFRIPFHVGGCLHLAPGIGPLLIVAMHEDEEDPEAIFGIGSGIGISYWFTSWAGVKMELGYELHFHEKLSHELVAATGVVFGW